MGLERIYFELRKREDDEYYVELAQNDVLFIPVITDIMLSDSNPMNIWAQMLLEKISEENPLIVYPYIGYISQVIDKKTIFNSWNVWKIISNLLVCDYQNYWENLKNKYYNSLNSERIAEFSIACDCACKIISAKPEEEKPITDILKNMKNRDFYINENLSPKSSEVAKNKAQEVLNELNLSKDN
ncbi:hypothetical protein [uncultured Ruminococcus sp.]|uniref:hypothetical protein n=1 Tax=uncultured Ruminococcus sp. TaxID=165186 RepID=UPI0025D6747F|nr:hypothetical protein [uncultured Ruminococcus sp.]